jgi:hypothetical protein
MSSDHQCPHVILSAYLVFLRLCVYLFHCLFVCMSHCLSVCLCVRWFVQLRVCVSVCLSISLSVCLSDFLSVFLCITGQSVCSSLSTSLCVCLLVCLRDIVSISLFCLYHFVWGCLCNTVLRVPVSDFNVLFYLSACLSISLFSYVSV